MGFDAMVHISISELSAMGSKAEVSVT
jgi:hypothetical protein